MTVKCLELPQQKASAPDTADQQGLIGRLRTNQKQSLVQVAPGMWRPIGALAPPDLVLARFQERGNGVYELVPACEQWVRLCPKVARLLGFAGKFETLRRLGRAGFIEIIYPAPSTAMLNLASWWGHLARVAEDVDGFWNAQTKQGAAHLKVYRENLF